MPPPASRAALLRGLLVSALLALLWAAPAQATLLVLPDGTPGPQPYQAWVDGALVPTPPGEVTVSLNGCAEITMPSCAPENQGRIELDAGFADRHVVLHELGHVFDDLMPEWARARFRALVAPRRTSTWSSARSPSPFNEQFAEAYALCAMKLSLRARHFGNYGYAPSPRMHRRVCALINAAGQGFGE